MWNVFRRIFRPRASAGKSGPRGRVLVIEDDLTTCKLIESVLSRRGHEVHVANDGTSGLEAARTQKPDIIFLDCLMPGISGVEAGKMLKDDPATEKIPIIVLTAVDTPKNIIDCYEFGADNYLVKPVSSRELLRLVETTLKDYELA
jgi:DNA-binding response OmpR family regulator